MQVQQTALTALYPASESLLGQSFSHRNNIKKYGSVLPYFIRLIERNETSHSAYDPQVGQQEGVKIRTFYPIAMKNVKLEQTDRFSLKVRREDGIEFPYCCPRPDHILMRSNEVAKDSLRIYTLTGCVGQAIDLKATGEANIVETYKVPQMNSLTVNEEDINTKEGCGLFRIKDGRYFYFPVAFEEAKEGTVIYCWDRNRWEEVIIGKTHSKPMNGYRWPLSNDAEISYDLFQGTGSYKDLKSAQSFNYVEIDPPLKKELRIVMTDELEKVLPIKFIGDKSIYRFYRLDKDILCFNFSEQFGYIRDEKGLWQGFELEAIVHKIYGGKEYMCPLGTVSEAYGHVQLNNVALKEFDPRKEPDICNAVGIKIVS